MERKDCIVCGTSFPLTRHHRLTCSDKCSERRYNELRKATDKAARRALLEPPLYNKTQLAEARHHIKLYDTPDKARGREYVLIRAHQIVEYWEKRNAIEDRVLKLRERARNSTSKTYWNRKNDQTKQ
jgi:hypothetical protein